jgi:HK97 family phage prohead protease
MKNKLRHITVPVTEFKYDSNTGEFTCYANVKNVIDHAQDRSVNGCFKASIERHKLNGTMPKQLWMHNPYGLPVGPWLEMSEDEKGLFMRGKLSKTSMGTDIEILAKDGALDSFSIGYVVIQERWNVDLKCNDLIEVDIKEVSWVNFACNEASLLQSIKTHMDDGDLPTKAELRELFKTTGWFSKRQIERITGAYNPVDENDEDIELTEIKTLLEESTLFK